MKKTLIKFGITLGLINLALMVNIGLSNITEAQTDVPQRPPGVYSPVEWLRQVGGEVKHNDKEIMPSFDVTGGHPDAPPGFEAGVSAATSPLLFVIDFLRYLMSGIAFIVVVVYAIKLITKANEEEMTKIKTGLIMAIVGLLVIQLADPLVKKMFFGEQGEALENIGVAELYAEETLSYIRGIIGLLHIFLGSVAVLVLVITGIKLIVSAGEEEEQTKAKKHVLYAVVGLAIVGISELVVRGFVFPKAGESLPDVNVGRKIIVDITNFLSGFIAIIAFVMLFFAGYKYVVSGGKEEETENVKKLVTAAVLGLVVALAAFALVNTLLDIGAPVIPEQ
jgi:hypothetical protein